MLFHRNELRHVPENFFCARPGRSARGLRREQRRGRGPVRVRTHDNRTTFGSECAHRRRGHFYRDRNGRGARELSVAEKHTADRRRHRAEIYDAGRGGRRQRQQFRGRGHRSGRQRDQPRRDPDRHVRRTAGARRRAYL